YSMPGLTPLFSFDTKVSSPGAFAVESSGVIDVFETTSTFALRRFSNTGTVVSFSTYTLSVSTPPWNSLYTYPPPTYMSATIDKVNGRLYIGFQYKESASLCLSVVGSQCGTLNIVVTYGAVSEYDFSGNELASYAMPGGYDDSINGAPFVV